MRINENFTEEWMYHMRVLVIGSGAREHAMADKLIESTSVTSVHSCPGNILMETIGLYPDSLLYHYSYQDKHFRRFCVVCV